MPLLEEFEFNARRPLITKTPRTEARHAPAGVGSARFCSYWLDSAPERTAAFFLSVADSYISFGLLVSG